MADVRTAYESWVARGNTANYSTSKAFREGWEMAEADVERIVYDRSLSAKQIVARLRHAFKEAHARRYPESAG
jgi:hypothetical protein